MNQLMQIDQMSLEDQQRILSRLAAPFPIDEIQWRAAGKDKNGPLSTIVAYIDARCVIQRLNAVFGLSWSSAFQPSAFNKPGSVEAALSVGKISRADVGTESNVEKEKGSYSDSLKRAAVQWGIGAYLYDFPTVKTDLGGNSWIEDKVLKELHQLVILIHDSTPPAQMPRFTHLTVRKYRPVQFPPPFCENCDNRIVSEKMTAIRAAAYTRHHFGQQLCASCVHMIMAQRDEERTSAKQLTDGGTNG